MLRSALRRAPTTLRLRPPSLDATALGLLALVSFGLSLTYALTAPPLWGVDERAHAGYVLSLLRGDLPTIWTWVLDDPERFPQLSDALARWKGIGRQVWVANHPPLYYLLAAPVVGLFDWLGMPGAALLSMRVLNAAATAGCVVLVGLLARELAPARRAVPLLAAALAAAASGLAIDGGYGYNDGVAGLTSATALLLGVRLLRRGPSRGLLWGAAFACAAAASAKAPNLAAVAAVAAMAATAAWLHSDRRRGARAAGAAVVVGGVPALAIGWFYLRNLRLYGDLTGAAVLLEAFQRQPVAPVWSIATQPGFYRRLFEGYWVRPSAGETLRLLPDLLLCVALVGLAMLAMDWLRRRMAHDGPSPPASPEVRGLRAAWTLLLGHAAVIMLSLIAFRSDGGNITQRYLIGLMPALATLLAVGVIRLAEALPHPNPAPPAALLVSAAILLTGLVAHHAAVRHVEAAGKAASAGCPWPQTALTLTTLAALTFLTLQTRALSAGSRDLEA